jgi:hypothetical protein
VSIDPNAAAASSAAAAFVWRDHGRFVEVYPVRTGWLVLWGRYEELGRRKILDGNRTYTDLVGTRRRVADAALALTGKPRLAAEAVAMLDRASLPDRRPPDLPRPL